MKINATNKYSFGFAPLMIAAMIFGGVQYCQKHKVMKANVTLNSELIAAQNAPIKVVRVVTHDTIKSTKWLTPKVVTLTSVKTDTVEKVKWCKFDYTDLYTFGKGDSAGSLTLNIHIADCQPKYNISNLNYPVINRTITKTVLKTINRDNFDWGLLAGLSINSLRSTPAPQLGMYLRDKKVTIGGSLLFNPADKLPYFNVLVGYSFRK
jgi:hypothetical protein